MTTLPATMTAIAISRPGGPEVLVPEERPVPEPSPTQILIRVVAAGVNRPDIFQRAGYYPPPKGASDLPGLEVSGEVVAIGADVTRWSVGDKVCALTPGGGYADYVVTEASSTLPIPAGLDMIEAAALPETAFTVWHNVFQRGHLAAGETFLVHGGSSGIGTMAIMLAKAFGARVIATAGSADKCDACRKLGADIAIDYRNEDWLSAVKQATDGHGVDLILDMVGGDYIPKNYDAAALDGRIVSIAFLKGARVEVDFTKLMTKRLTHTGSTLRAQSNEAKARIAAAVGEAVWPLVADGRCRPVIQAVFPLRDAARAHEAMEAGSHIGKIVLDVADTQQGRYSAL